jgi:hypothetical protein
LISLMPSQLQVLHLREASPLLDTWFRTSCFFLTPSTIDTVLNSILHK